LNANNQSREYDIMIYGGTSAGIAAAILSSRMGKSVLVIEPSSSIGVASKKKN
jgi:flavin-dependent dehydrogenase